PVPFGITTLGNVLSVMYWTQVLPPTVAVKKSGRKVSANRSSSQAVRGNLGAVLPSAGGGVVDTSSATSARSKRMAYIPSNPPQPASLPPCYPTRRQPPPCQPPPCQPPPSHPPPI